MEAKRNDPNRRYRVTHYTNGAEICGDWTLDDQPSAARAIGSVLSGGNLQDWSGYLLAQSTTGRRWLAQLQPAFVLSDVVELPQ